jgi:hypothetical protein
MKETVSRASLRGELRLHIGLKKSPRETTGTRRKVTSSCLDYSSALMM